jgi:hypothetical protein
VSTMFQTPAASARESLRERAREREKERESERENYLELSITGGQGQSPRTDSAYAESVRGLCPRSGLLPHTQVEMATLGS